MTPNFPISQEVMIFSLFALDFCFLFVERNNKTGSPRISRDSLVIYQSAVWLKVCLGMFAEHGYWNPDCDIIFSVTGGILIPTPPIINENSTEYRPFQFLAAL